MQTITDEYRAQNAEIHATQKYGQGSFRHAQQVQELLERTESYTVLDYGCGKGSLGAALGRPEWFFEYDPAIEGKEELPDAVDMVVCTDVLEHVEPDLLDNVLRHIADLSKRAVWLTIALKPSKNILPDGRNAHLILESPEWWRAKLEEYFLISDWETEDTEIIMLGSTIRQVAELVTKSAVSNTLRLEQAKRNCGIVKDRVLPRERHDGQCVIACYGPSLKHEWDHIAVQREDGAVIVTVSGAHDFLIERGIVPDIHIECDPRIHKAAFTQNSHPDVTYWPSSCCHPALIDQLVENDRAVALWHVYNSDEDFGIIKPDGPDPGASLIAGGGSVGCRAFNVMYVQGYRRFAIYGMDCSFEEDGEQHAGDHTGKPHIEWPIRLGDRWFKTSGALVATARGWLENLKAVTRISRERGEPDIDGLPQPIKVDLFGDGLLQAMAGGSMAPHPTKGSDKP